MTLNIFIKSITIVLALVSTIASFTHIKAMPFDLKPLNNIALVGVKGNTRELKREVHRYHHDIPAFAADRKFLSAIGGFQASPTTLIYDTNGQLITKKRGFIPFKNLSKALNIISQGKCKI